ncbi:MAG: hypothetical protein GY926_24575 [bacterium]|nr:hypothetical protein [bacterium]
MEQLGPGPLTFVITAAGQLRLGPRESEHVQIAGGSPVQTAGEISFTTTSGVTVESITNQSTGYCPEPGSISALHAIAKQLKVAIPDSFTTEVMFRRCPTCEATNIVKDDWFVCAECSAELPPTWNFS